jgi:hypothetical protein
MRKDAKEFRAKKSSNHIDKTQSMNLPKLPLSDDVSYNNNPLPSSKKQSSSNFRGPANGMIKFDKERFENDFVKGNKKLPPELLNFFMNNDINELSAQFMAALQEGKIHNQPQHGKSIILKPKQIQLEKQMSQPDAVTFDESTLQIEKKADRLRATKKFQKPRSIQGSRKNSRHSSRNSSKEGSKNGCKKMSDKKGKHNFHCRHYSSQFKQDSMINLKRLEADVLYANYKYPPRKVHSINTKKKYVFGE